MQFWIRNVRQDELKRLGQIFMRAYQGLERYGERSRGEGISYLEGLYGDCPEGFLVADAPEGTVGLIVSDPSWQDRSRGEVLEIHELVVDPAWQGKGVAKALMSEAFAFGRARGREAAALWVGVGNKYAREWYQSLGFQEEGQRREWIRMYRPLNDVRC
ncbi:MAG: N-acetyltransferase [Candidatus Bipolaricaulota bacterium]